MDKLSKLWTSLNNKTSMALLYMRTGMVVIPDIARAINDLWTRVASQGRFQNQKGPGALWMILCDELRTAAERGETESAPLEPSKAIAALKTRIGGNPDKKTLQYAIGKITKALDTVRIGTPSARLSQLSEQNSGVAWITHRIDGYQITIGCQGPRPPGQAYLQLRLIPDDALGHAAWSSAHETASESQTDLSPAIDSLFPHGFDQTVSLITRNIHTALSKFRDSTRHLVFVQRHILDSALRLEGAAVELCNGHIVTEYDDCSLLTREVAVLDIGDELLGVTEWQEDCHWWEGEDGRRFRNANAASVARGAAVRRIFAYPASESRALRDKRTIEMAAQLKAGVQVRAISVANVERLGIDVRSMCVIRSSSDTPPSYGWLTYRVERQTAGRRNCFSLRPQDIRENCLLLEEIWDRAKEPHKTRTGGA